MSPEMVWFLGSQIVLIINIATLLIALRRRYNRLFSIAMFVVLDLILFTILIVTGETPGSTRSITGFAFLPLIIWLFKESFFQKVFAVFLVLQFTVGLTSLAGGLADLFAQSGSGEYTMIHFSISLVLLSVYGVLIFRYGRDLLTKLFAYGRQKEWALYSLGAVFSYAVMLFVNNSFGGVERIFLILFILWGFAVLCFAIINTHEKTKKGAEAEFASRIITTGRNHYRKMDELYDKLRILNHDYKYHLAVMGELLSSGDEEKISAYLSGVQAKLSEYEMRNYCSNNVINALLSSYSERCDDIGVQFDVTVFLPTTLTIPDYDLCIVVGNLLENALEACAKPDGGGYIQFRVKPLGEQLALMVRNSFDGKLEVNDGKVASTKKEGGLGLRSVEAVAARYDGELTTQCDGEMFTAYVTVRN